MCEEDRIFGQKKRVLTGTLVLFVVTTEALLFGLWSLGIAKNSFNIN